MKNVSGLFNIIVVLIVRRDELSLMTSMLIGINILDKSIED